MKHSLEKLAASRRPLALALGNYVAEPCPDSEFESRLERAARLMGALPSDAALLYSRGLFEASGAPRKESTNV